jgi:membrane protease YdiL (CAAX protease family)
VSELFHECNWLELALVALLAGVGEELLFRGVVQHAAAERWGAGAGLVIASLAFGFAHPLSLTYIVLAATIGFYLGWLWLASGNLLVPIVAHGLYDFIALIYLRYRASRPAT